MIRQRIRGIVRTTIATCVPWMTLGLLAGAVFQFDLIPNVHGALGRPIIGGFLTLGLLAGAVVGIVNGLVFSALVLTTERGKSVDQLRAWRVAGLGAIATGVSLGLLIQSPLAGAIGAVAGAAAALVALRVARNAPTTSPAIEWER